MSEGDPKGVERRTRIKQENEPPTSKTDMKSADEFSLPEFAVPALGTLAKPSIFGVFAFREGRQKVNNCRVCGLHFVFHIRLLCRRPVIANRRSYQCSGWVYKLKFSNKFCTDCICCVGGMREKT